VHRDAAVTRPSRLRGQLIPLRQRAADLALRQLEEQRSERLADVVEVGHRQRRSSVTDGARDQAVQVGVPAVLVQLDV
jgi:hypothetical protein